MSFEASRKHGAFDTRWPSGRAVRSAGAPSSRPLLATDAAEGLDWDAFASRYVGGLRRHNLEALAAYAASREGREWGSNGHPKKPKPRLIVVPKDPVPPAIEAASDAGARRLLAAVAAVQTWEGEGGYTPQTDES
jgi:hypothetical protein